MSELYPRHSVITIDRQDFRRVPPQQAGGDPSHLSARCL